MRGRERLASKPGDEEIEALEDVRRLWGREGSDVEVYCPGRRRTSVAAPDADSTAPTVIYQREHAKQAENMTH